MNGPRVEEPGDCGAVMTDELTRFCRFTSLRGVPRTIRPGSSCLRVIWIIAVFSLLTLSAWQVTLLIQDYYAYPKVTLIYETTVPMLGLNFTITVCDLNPLSSQAETHKLPGDLSLSTIENVFYRSVYNFTSCPKCDEIRRRQMLRIRQRAATEIGLFQDMGREAAAEYGHEEDTFIMSCQIMGLGANDYIYKPCIDRTLVRVITTPEYLNCFSIDVFDYSEYMPGVGVNLVLFLDNPIGNVSEGYIANRKRGRQSRGILLEVHDTKEYPTLGKYAIAAPPGHKIHMKFEMDQRDRRNIPYGTCVDTQYIENYTIDGEKLKYTTEVCYQVCQQIRVAKICGCKQPWQLGYILDGLNHLPYCATTKDGRSKFIERMKCVVGREEQVYNTCQESCQATCKRFMFKTSHSLSQWPTTGNIIDIYSIYLRNTIAEDILASDLNMIKTEHKSSDSYTTAAPDDDDGLRRGRRHHDRSVRGRYHRSTDDLDDISQGDMDKVPKMSKRPRRRAKLDLNRVVGDFGAFRMLADNLIMVEALLKDDTYLVISDEIKTPYMELISQIGGILNLWSGLNVIILIEIFELFYRLVSHGITNYQAYRHEQEIKAQGAELNQLNQPNKDVSNRCNLQSSDINQL